MKLPNSTTKRIDLQISCHVSSLLIIVWRVSDVHYCTVDDFARVNLEVVEGVEGSDYINASFIDASFN